MVLYLRTKKNKTVFEAEIYVKTDYEKDGLSHKYVELSSNIYIDEYSYELLSFDEYKEKNHFINVFYNLSELRGWMWESYFMVKKNTPDELDNVIKEVKSMLNIVAKKYNLIVVED